MLVYYRATLKTTITQRRQNQSDMVVSIDVGTPIAGWFIMEIKEMYGNWWYPHDLGNL